MALRLLSLLLLLLLLLLGIAAEASNGNDVGTGAAGSPGCPGVAGGDPGAAGGQTAVGFPQALNLRGFWAPPECGGRLCGGWGRSLWGALPPAFPVLGFPLPGERRAVCGGGGLWWPGAVSRSHACFWHWLRARVVTAVSVCLPTGGGQESERSESNPSVKDEESNKAQNEGNRGTANEERGAGDGGQNKDQSKQGKNPSGETGQQSGKEEEKTKHNERTSPCKEL